MPLFKYKAMSQQGKRLEGEFSANTSNEVLAMIRENGYFPIAIEEKIEGKDINLSDMFIKVKAKDLAILCRQFATLLEAGADILNTVNILRKQTENNKLRASLNQIYEEIQKGYTLSSCMSKFGDVYPRLLINMIASGEETGQLATVMERMAEQFERDNRIESKIKGAMTYPIILAIISIGAVVLLLTVVMPTFVGMFEGSGAELPGPTKFVMGLSDVIKANWYIILSVIVIISVILKMVFKTEKGGIFIDRIKLNLPMISNTTRKIATMRFSRGLATTLYSGVTMVSAIEIVSKIIGNRLIEAKLEFVREKVVKGIPLNEALHSIQEFPPMLLAMVKIGEESGAIDTILEKTSKFYEEEVEEAIAKLTTMIEPVMILIMGVLIGGIVIAMIMPMFEMFNTVM